MSHSCRFSFGQVCSADVLSNDDRGLAREMALWLLKANNHKTYSWVSEGDFPAMQEFEKIFGKRGQGQGEGQSDQPPVSLFEMLGDR